MRYMMLIYSKETDRDSLPDEERRKDMEGHLAVMDETAKRGILVAVSPLARTSAATTVRVDQGKVLTTDGPYAETKEQLGGILVLEARDLNQAIQLMSQHPAVKYGSSFEIRPSGDMTELMKESEQRRRKDTSR